MSTTTNPIERRTTALGALGPPVEVIILDSNTAERIGVGSVPVPSSADDVELYYAETKTPDGPGAILHEHRVWPRLMAVLGLVGLIGVGGLLYLRDGVNAAVLGLVWLGMGYCVAWIVVWAAGLARAREEIELENTIEQRHRQG